MTPLLAAAHAHAHVSSILPATDSRLLDGLLIVAALFVAAVTLPYARRQYRETHRRWPLAKLTWIMVGGGMELLMGAAIAVGMSGELANHKLPATIFLAIAVICGATGTLMSCIGIILLFITGLIAFFRSGSYDASHED